MGKIRACTCIRYLPHTQDTRHLCCSKQQLLKQFFSRRTTKSPDKRILWPALVVANKEMQRATHSVTAKICFGNRNLSLEPFFGFCKWPFTDQRSLTDFSWASGTCTFRLEINGLTHPKMLWPARETDFLRYAIGQLMSFRSQALEAKWKKTAN